MDQLHHYQNGSGLSQNSRPQSSIYESVKVKYKAFVTLPGPNSKSQDMEHSHLQVKS